jgi:hypothetical protein
MIVGDASAKNGMGRRPSSARPVSAYSKASASSRNTLRPPINRKVPQRIRYDKEQLYDVNMHLKIEAGKVLEENNRLKTRI